MLSSSTASKEDGHGELVAVNAMDVVLDACWAVVSEIDQMDGPIPDHLKGFADKRTDMFSISSDLIDGELLRKIGGRRCPKDRYELIEKIGKGAYGNVLSIAHAPH